MSNSRLSVNYGNVGHTFDDCTKVDIHLERIGTRAGRVTIVADFPIDGSDTADKIPGPTGTPLSGVISDAIRFGVDMLHQATA